MAKQRKPTFTRQQYERLKNAQRIIHDLQTTFDKMDACGMDCQAFRALAQDLGRRLTAFEREFLTPPPRI